MKKIIEFFAAAGGVVASFFCSIPPVVWILIVVMSLDFITGIIKGIMCKSEKTENGGLSSSAAFRGLMKKIVILVVIGLAALIDRAVSVTADIQFAATLYATALWFIASEGMSILENVALIGVPVPKILQQALEIFRKKGDGEEPKANSNKQEQTEENTED